MRENASYTKFLTGPEFKMRVLLLERDNLFANDAMNGLVNSDLGVLPCSTYSEALELAHSDGDISAFLFCVETIDEALTQFVRHMKTATHKCRAIAIMLSPNADDYITLTLNGVDECFTVPVDTALISLALNEMDHQRFAGAH